MEREKGNGSDHRQDDFEVAGRQLDHLLDLLQGGTDGGQAFGALERIRSDLVVRRSDQLDLNSDTAIHQSTGRIDF